LSSIKTFFLYLTRPGRISERNKAISAAKTVAVEINESYRREVGEVYGPAIRPGQAYSGTPRYKCGESARRLVEGSLRSHGLKVVKRSEPHDLKITVQISGRCIPKLYVWPGGRKAPVYSGASVGGHFSLCPGDLPEFRRSFSGIKNPPESIRNPGSSWAPVYAPFDQAFKKSDFASKLKRTFTKFFGKT